tara:strand:+ start:12542 stop:13153 length:612 start_codon:yes stop_codon:yes gene_type:complete
MEITKNQLRQLITEELNEVLQATDLIPDWPEDTDHEASEVELQMDALAKLFDDLFFPEGMPQEYKDQLLLTGTGRGQENDDLIATLANAIASNPDNPDAQALQREIERVLTAANAELTLELSNFGRTKPHDKGMINLVLNSVGSSVAQQLTDLKQQFGVMDYNENPDYAQRQPPELSPEMLAQGQEIFGAGDLKEIIQRMEEG